MQRGTHKVVLFDLDGTLVDTAPDMVRVLQDLQRQHGYAPVPYEFGRSNVSNGALGLLRIGFPELTEAERQDLIGEYIDRYSARLSRCSTLFAGMEALLGELDAVSCQWGVVTNKPARLTEPLLEQLQLASRSACIVSGDTLEQRKPHPAPLLYACRLTGVQPAQAIYVGDASRDIEAGRAAGLMTIAAAYGYITADDNAEAWGADLVAADTTELAQIVLKAVNLVS
ncbi:MAG: HAD-IA family hydrolase [Gammaproteobacteria bacterium]|nr:HAD-IA family hydrolase [Gammaproteobacteria bacterium]